MSNQCFTIDTDTNRNIFAKQLENKKCYEITKFNKLLLYFPF